MRSYEVGLCYIPDYHEKLCIDVNPGALTHVKVV
jgi:hypothetical protein